MPELHIIMGSNGAGKSSIGHEFLPTYIRESCAVFDGDKLYMQKQKELWLQGIRAIKEAKNIAFAFVESEFERLADDALKASDHFVYEGHFTNDATWDIPKKFHEQGYEVYIYFLGLTDPELSELRVVDRAKEGGHYVQPVIIRDNFYGNLEKLNIHFAVANNLKIMDTSAPAALLILHLENNKILYSVSSDRMPEWFKKWLPALHDLIVAGNK